MNTSQFSSSPLHPKTPNRSSGGKTTWSMMRGFEQPNVRERAACVDVLLWGARRSRLVVDDTQCTLWLIPATKWQTYSPILLLLVAVTTTQNDLGPWIWLPWSRFISRARAHNGHANLRILCRLYYNILVYIIQCHCDGLPRFSARNEVSLIHKHTDVLPATICRQGSFL